MAKHFPNIEWDLANSQGHIETWERVSIAVLMDIRRELQTLNRLLSCPNFTEIPRTLRSIRRAMPRRKKRS